MIIIQDSKGDIRSLDYDSYVVWSSWSIGPPGNWVAVKELELLAVTRMRKPCG